jgi:excinuclease ABC subunit B
MAEELTEYYCECGVRAKYLHSEITTIERTEIIRDLRLGKFDVLIGINLLREGLDLPEVSLVAVLDADKEGFLRSEVSLIQTCGRAARNICGQVIMYADRITKSMQRTIDETNRRRRAQSEFNRAHRITPQSIVKSISTILDTIYEADYVTVPLVSELEVAYGDPSQLHRRIVVLKKEMKAAAAKLEFEHAAELRDQIMKLEKQLVEKPI